MRKGRVKGLLALTAGLLAAGAVVGAPQALADPGDIEDRSLWRTSPKCNQPEDIVLKATGYGVIEFEYRVIGGEPTTHKARPPAQDPFPGEVVRTAIPEHQVRWRAIAYDIQAGPPALNRGDILTVEAKCVNDPLAKQSQIG